MSEADPQTQRRLWGAMVASLGEASHTTPSQSSSQSAHAGIPRSEIGGVGADGNAGPPAALMISDPMTTYLYDSRAERYSFCFSVTEIPRLRAITLSALLSPRSPGAENASTSSFAVLTGTEK